MENQALFIDELSQHNADPHKLYELAVQCVEASIDSIEYIYGHRSARMPLSLREDFCGTAALSAQWVRSHGRRRAVGLDIDKCTLAWAAHHNLAALGDATRRISLLECNVLEPPRQRFDVIAAFNFSYWVFKQRDILRQYFRNVRRSLAPDGVFIIDLYGGPDAQYTLSDVVEKDGFTYVWEQERFDPFSHETLCHIHFRFPDGTALERAFTYDWRVWTAPELRDALQEAGFGQVEAFWDSPKDELERVLSATNQVSWIAYLAAWK